MKISYLACALVLVGCEPQLVGELVARPVVRGENSVGWQRVELDGVAHRERDSLWLGDGQGRSVPFLFETGEVWRPKQLEVVDPLAGKNESNQPTFEFGVGVPQGWQVGEREQLRVDFELGYVGTFVADVVVERKRDDGQYWQADQDNQQTGRQY